jgi:hypothetical protein
MFPFALAANIAEHPIISTTSRTLSRNTFIVIDDKYACLVDASRRTSGHS